MSDKQTHCPTCSTTYKVSVAQLTIAQGMVCCPKCTTTFNALSHLVTENQNSVTASDSAFDIIDHNSRYPTQTDTSGQHNNQVQRPRHSFLNIFDEKVENSNIDLHTYLNNLNYFSTTPISVLPSMNWDESDKEQEKSLLYYAGWSLLNLSLLGLLLFQFFWFNPKYLQNSHVMSMAFTQICEMFNCSHINEHYNLIHINKVKIRSVAKNETQFSGELVNLHDRSLSLPILRVNLKKHGKQTVTYNLTSQEYLIESLVKVERIPQNSPFKFKFSLPVDRKDFDNYSLEIIRP